jgi:hypothetical protein
MARFEAPAFFILALNFSKLKIMTRYHPYP